MNNITVGRTRWSRVLLSGGLALGLALAGAGPAAAGDAGGPRDRSGGVRAMAEARWIYLDERLDATGDAAKEGVVGPVAMDPELVWSAVDFQADDPSEPGDEASVVWFDAETSGRTDGTDLAAVALDVNGDLKDDYWLESPQPPIASDMWYETPVWKVVSGKDVDTGFIASWHRWESDPADPDGWNGYSAVINWKELGLTKVRYAFLLEDATGAYDWAPNDYTGALLSLPQPPKAPTSVKAVAGTYAATVSWARPSSAYEVLDYKVLA
ncbi:MAG: hypothetical protein MUD05_10955, partial [Candidatus Nanopelagicales bacterium]|nr:hypothetical protein [Candidatus Nanopelagicales bacterium]